MPHPQVDPQVIEQTRKHINRLREEVARLSEMDISPADYFGEFLTRVLQALAAPAGAVWIRTPHGNLQLQAQVQMQRVGLDRSDAAKEMHTELLRQAVQQVRPMVLQPQSSTGTSQGTGPAPGNPTDYLLLLVPILTGNQVAGLIEVWQDPSRHPSAIQGFLQFLVHLADLASRFLRNRLLGEMIGQQELWTKMEVFARQIHESLNPVEVAYRIANEGRRLIDCDRVSVGVRYGRRVVVDAVSGADVVEKRSNLVQRMRTLFERVLAWGEKLVYTGTKDDSLPPDVLKALDAYLEESSSKVLVVVPLRDERETEGDAAKKPPRSLLMMECFEPAAAPDQLVARVEVLGRHASSALYNAVEHRRIPFRFFWQPIASVQEGLGGKTRAILYGILAGLLVLAAVMYFVPYPLKMDASGQLLPEERRWVYAPPPGGRVLQFNVEAGTNVGEDENLVLMHDLDVVHKLQRLEQDIKGTSRELEGRVQLLSQVRAEQERHRLTSEIAKLGDILRSKVDQRDAMLNVIRIVPEQRDQPGQFWLRSPPFLADGSLRDPNARWTVLNSDYKEKLTGAKVEPKEPILRLGYVDGPWEVVLKIPQKHIGQVLLAVGQVEQEKQHRLAGLLDKAAAAGWVSKDDGADLRQVRLADLQERFRSSGVMDRALNEGWLKRNESDELLREPELDVDLLVKSAPTEVYRGKLARSRISGAADQHRDENNEAEPVVLARVRISGDDIPAADQVPRRLLLTDTQVNAKVRCGNHRMGYSLFYGVWEFFYEKVVFFF